MSPLRQFIGIPYVDSGREVSGADCWGLCLLYYRKLLNQELPDYRSYSSAEDKHQVSKTILDNQSNWLSVDRDLLKPNDIVCFRISGVPFHTGIYLGKQEFLHCHRGVNSCIERLDSLVWRNRFYRGFRWQAN